MEIPATPELPVLLDPTVYQVAQEQLVHRVPVVLLVLQDHLTDPPDFQEPQEPLEILVVPLEIPGLRVLEGSTDSRVLLVKLVHI